MEKRQRIPREEIPVLMEFTLKQASFETFNYSHGPSLKPSPRNAGQWLAQDRRDLSFLRRPYVTVLVDENPAKTNNTEIHSFTHSLIQPVSAEFWPGPGEARPSWTYSPARRRHSVFAPVASVKMTTTRWLRTSRVHFLTV